MFVIIDHIIVMGQRYAIISEITKKIVLFDFTSSDMVLLATMQDDQAAVLQHLDG